MWWVWSPAHKHTHLPPLSPILGLATLSGYVCDSLRCREGLRPEIALERYEAGWSLWIPLYKLLLLLLLLTAIIGCKNVVAWWVKGPLRGPHDIFSMTTPVLNSVAFLDWDGHFEQNYTLFPLFGTLHAELTRSLLIQSRHCRRLRRTNVSSSDSLHNQEYWDIWSRI